MYRRDRDIDALPYTDRHGWDPEDAGWDAEDDPPRRERRGVFGRLFALVKLGLLALPVALFLYGSYADCSGPPATGWLGLLGTGACARHAMFGSVASVQDNFALLKRITE